MKKYLAFIVCFLTAALATSTHAQVLTLQPLNTFGTNGDGSIWPGQITGTNQTDPFFPAIPFTSGSAERAIAYNPISGHLLVVQRTNVFSPSDYHIYVLDGLTGTNILNAQSNVMELDISGPSLSGGNNSFIYNLIGVADDGGIYVANLSNAANPPTINIYYWANESATRVAVYSGNPGDPNQSQLNQRWGDSFAVRGSGINTQLLLASRGSTLSILTAPTGTPDWLSNPFIGHVLQSDVSLTNGIGFGLCFGAGNTIYTKAASAAGNPLIRLSFNLNAGTATTLQTFSLTNFPGRTCALNALISSNLLVGVEPVAGNDYVRLYDISDPTIPPVQVDRQQFTTNAANNLLAGSVTFGNNGLVYALDNDNGVRAFTLTSVPVNNLAPSFILQPATTTVYPNALGVLPTNADFVATADGTPDVSYQWYQGTTTLNATTPIPGATNITYSFPNPALTDNGKTLAVVATNLYGSVTSSVVVLGVSATIPVSLPWYEPFDYPVGAIGTNGGWNITSGNSGNAAAGNLSVPWLPTPKGNMFSWLNGTMSYRLPFGTRSSGTVYYSIALKVTDLAGLNTVNNTTPGTLCGFANGVATSFMKLTIITNGAGQYSLGCGFAGAAAVFETNLHEVGETVFVVQSYTFGAGTNTDLCTTWINPDPSTFSAANPPTPTTLFYGAIGGGSFDRFFFRHSGANQPSGMLGDELRLGFTWADVTPQASPPLSVAFDGTNAVLSWPTIAAGYTVRSSTVVPSASWTAVTNAISTLGTNYVVKVKATNQARYFELIK